MYTLLTVIWFFCLIQNISLAKAIDKRYGEVATFAGIFGTWAASFILEGAFFSDIFGVNKTITIGNFVILVSPINLAIQTIVSFFLQRKQQAHNKSKKIVSPSLSIPKVLFDLLSLIASILGIISFYLDYIK